MIDFSTVRRIISHANSTSECADGILAAALACYGLGRRIETIFVKYDSPEHRRLAPQAGDLFLDMTPWHEKVEDEDGEATAEGWAQIQRWVDAGAIVVDHHIGAERVVARFGERGIYSAEPGVSAATLVYRHMVRDPDGGRLPGEKIAEYLAEIVGRRDAWDRGHEDFERGSAAVAALSFYGFDAILDTVLSDVIVDGERKGKGGGWVRVEEMLAIGPHLLAADMRRASACLASAHRMNVSGGRGSRRMTVRVVAFNSSTEADASNVADILTCRACELSDGTGEVSCWTCMGTGTHADLVVAWHVFAAEGRLRMICRLRSRGDGFACLPLAEFYKGGGHRHAAGFTTDLTPADGDPLAQIQRMVAAFLIADRAPKPIAACMLVRDDQGRLLLAQRCNNPGDMGLLGGKTEPGETAEACAIREAHEEARVVVTACREVYSANGVVTFEATAWERDPGDGDCPVRWGTWEEAEAGSFGAYNTAVRKAVGA